MRHQITDRERKDREHYGSRGPKANSMAHERRIRKAAEFRAKMEQERKDAVVAAAKSIKAKQRQNLAAALESL